MIPFIPNEHETPEAKAAHAATVAAAREATDRARIVPQYVAPKSAEQRLEDLEKRIHALENQKPALPAPE